MFHYTRLDMFCNDVKPYADTDGYVPEAEDISEDFSYPDKQFSDLHSWNEYIQSCVMATHAAEKKLNAWQNNL